jgi:hypothetical protein
LYDNNFRPSRYASNNFVDLRKSPDRPCRVLEIVH